MNPDRLKSPVILPKETYHVTSFILGLILVAVTILAPALQAAQNAEATTTPTSVSLPFYVYRGFHAPENHYIPSGWMGDARDIRFSDRFTDPSSKKMVIRVEYTAKAAQGNGWSGMYWQNPANNWGSRPGGYNLNGARKITFLARGEKGGEMIDQFKMGGISGDYSDSGSAAIGPVTLTQDWKRYEISLEGQELSSITGGFCWAANRDGNPDGAIFYLDDIRYE
jgi:hypothetical protein